MTKTLTIADVMKDKIDAAAFVTGGKTTPARKAYRTRTGAYVGELSQTWIRMDDKGRKSVSILVKLYEGVNGELKFRGTSFAKASWTLVTKADGTPDLPFKLFQQIIGVLGAPPSASIDQVLGAIEGETMEVWGKEYFNVALEHLEQPAEVAGHGYKTSRVYLNEGDDDIAEKYLKLGYKSEFHIMRFSELD